MQRRIAARAGIASTPANWMRHNFASYHIHRGLDLTLMIMCHEGSPTTFWNRYSRRTTKDEAGRCFAVEAGAYSVTENLASAVWTSLADRT